MPSSPSRTRIVDIAREAGVSTATVDRVLNRRPGVRESTIQRVLKIAGKYDYLPESRLFESLRPKPMRLTFLLPSGTNRYLRMLGDMVTSSEEHLAPFNVRCRNYFIEGFNPEVLAERLLYHGRRADGIAFMALEHPRVREAVATLADEGIPVVTLVSDLTHSRRVAYVGLDNRAAGRTAGLIVGRFLGGRGAVALIAGSRSYRGHEEREVGFLSLMNEMFPAMRVVGLREGQDDAEKNRKETRQLLKQFPDIAGIYNIGGAADGVAMALKDAGHDQKIVLVGHGLTPDTRSLLIDGAMDAVLTQPPLSVVMNCVRIFCNLREKRDPLAGVEPLRISVVFRENLP